MGARKFLQQPWLDISKPEETLTKSKTGIAEHFFYQSELSIKNKFLSKEVQISCLKHKSLTQNEGILYFQRCNRYVLISLQILTIEFWKKVWIFFLLKCQF